MNLKPLDDRIVVEPSEAEERTASGLVIPDTAKEKPQQGKVLAVEGQGEDARAQVSRDGMTVSGDSIMGLLMLAASRGTSIDGGNQRAAFCSKRKS